MGVSNKLMNSLTEANQLEVEELLFQLLKIESHQDYSAYEKELADFIVDYFKREGIECDYQEVVDGRSNVIARLNGDKTGPVLVFNGHMDTVPPYEMENAFTPRIENELIYGRGSVDMKGALATMMNTLVQLKRSGIALKGDVVFVATIGEEVYSPGAYHFANSGFKADYIIIGEPTDLKVGIAHKGAVLGEAIFEGHSVHGSIPDKGINAIYSASRWIEKVQNDYIPQLKKIEHPILGHPTFNVGQIEGGTRPVIVPNYCKVTFEQRSIPGQTGEEIIYQLQELINELTMEDPQVKGTVKELPQFRGIPHGPLESKPDSLVVNALCEAYKNEFKEEITPQGLGFWTDGALLSTIDGAETVVCGPGSIEQAHSNEEYISREQLCAASRIYMSVACELCM